MSVISYGRLELADKPQSLDCFDSECGECIKRAGRLAVDTALAAVIDIELTENEKTAVRLYWFRGMKIKEIAAQFGVSADNIRKIMARAKRKIYKNLKYLVLYNELVGKCEPVPEDFHFKIVMCKNGKELIS